MQGTPIIASKVFHYLATGEAIQERVSAILDLRGKAGISERPLVIWEPDPRKCNPQNLGYCLAAASCVDVVSPNHIELAGFFGVQSGPALSKPDIEVFASKFLESGIGPTGDGTVVVRAGENGCLVKSRALCQWLPPFYEAKAGQGQADEVVDPTGAGNIFLGGYAIGYLRTGNIAHAACYGSVCASFALEQVGMPKKTMGEHDAELWNGVSVSDRLQEYVSRKDISLEL